MPGAKWCIRRLHNILPKCSAKYFAVKNACDVIRSVRSYPAKYYFAAEKASGLRRALIGLLRPLPCPLAGHPECVSDERAQNGRVDGQLVVPPADAHVGRVVAARQAAAEIYHAEQRVQHVPLAGPHLGQVLAD